MTHFIGGGRNTVPKPGTDLPEITDARTLYANMQFYNLLGHGAMYPGQHNVFLVPENTWILFVTRASVPADKRKSGTLRRVLDDFYFMRPGESLLQWHERIYTAMNDGSLFREILYQSDAQEEFSIYEPGDLIQDLTLQFHNESWPLMRLGIWKCPMGNDVKKYLDDINNTVGIAEYSDRYKTILTTTLPGIAVEKPQFASAIAKIIEHIKNYSKVTYESDTAFRNQADVDAALKDKEINAIFNEVLTIIQQSGASPKSRDNQYYFFQMNENILEYSPSATDIKQNSRGKITKFLESTLYTLLNEKQFTTKKTRANPNPSVSDDLLLQTPKYRFIVVDACRSIEAIGKPQALYAKREALTRRLSVSVRHQVCMNSLIQLNRRRFAELVSGRTIAATSPIARLLAGDNVPLPEFEASLVSAPEEELRNVLERPFKQGDTVFFRVGSRASSGQIQSVFLNNSGKLKYNITLIPSGQKIHIPAGKVFRSVGNALSVDIGRGLETLEREAAENIEAARQAEAVTELIQKKVAEKTLAKQKEEWDIQYSRLFKDRYGEVVKRYAPRLDVMSRVASQKVKAGDLVVVEKPYVQNGKLGYIVRSGAEKAFFEAANVNNSEERNRLYDALKKFPEGKRFSKLTLVQITGMPEKASFLNGKIGRVVDIGTAKLGGVDTNIYRVEVVVDVNGKPTEKIYPIKSENLALAPQGSVFQPLPVDLVSDYTKLVLTPEQEAAILAEVTAEVTRNAGNEDLLGDLGANEGGRRRKRTRRSVKRRRQTKRRASKH